MRKINIKDVKDGMILADPLENAHGSVLVGKGTVLTEALAARLAARDVTTLYIEGEPEGSENKTPEEPHSQRNDEHTIPLERLFENKTVNKSMQMIYEALKRYGK